MSLCNNNSLDKWERNSASFNANNDEDNVRRERTRFALQYAMDAADKAEQEQEEEVHSKPSKQRVRLRRPEKKSNPEKVSAAAELQIVVDVWPSLPAVVRKGIVAMVQATESNYLIG